MEKKTFGCFTLSPGMSGITKTVLDESFHWKHCFIQLDTWMTSEGLSHFQILHPHLSDTTGYYSEYTFLF